MKWPDDNPALSGNSLQLAAIGEAVVVKPVSCFEGDHELEMQLFGDLLVARSKGNGPRDVCHI
jgi:hypothetical protein